MGLLDLHHIHTVRLLLLTELPNVRSALSINTDGQQEPIGFCCSRPLPPTKYLDKVGPPSISSSVRVPH